MSFDTAKVFIDDLLADKYSDFTRDNTFAVIIDFIGGEPLMEINLIEQIVEYTSNTNDFTKSSLASLYKI